MVFREVIGALVRSFTSTVSTILDGGAGAVEMRFRFGPSNETQELGGVVMSRLLLYDVATRALALAATRF